MKTQFDNEELEILEAYKNNKLKVSTNNNIEIENSDKIAKNTIEQNEELYIKISGKNL
jgi:hypothetical protein